jgi:early secretory antigenic target protein ESAT-6
MSGFRVTPEQLKALSTRVDGGAQNILSELAGLRGALAPLEGEWTGQARERFRELYDQWDVGAQQLQQALDGIARLLQQAGQSYEDAERSVASSFAG